MHKIEFNTHIKAPLHICYDLVRSIDFHRESVPFLKEEAVAGCSKGLIGPDQHVLIQSKIGQVKFSAEMKLAKFTPPYFISYEIVNNIFNSVIHDYYFYDLTQETVMVNHFYYKPRYGVIGWFFNFIFLKRFLARFIAYRNNLIREHAESDKWKLYLTVDGNSRTIVC